MDKACKCCSPDVEQQERDENVESIALAGVCPECGTIGKPVDDNTVKSHLAVTLRRVAGAEYRFCAAIGCSVVYYSSDGLSLFRSEELREQVYQKDPENDDVLVCYCFKHSVGDMRSSSPPERAAIADDITEGTTLGQCACELRNPQGSCCLGNVRALIRRLSPSEVASSAAPRRTA